MKLHPLCELFPVLEGQAFDDLVKDIKEHGQLEPIITFDNLILDGQNRYRACLAAGKVPLTEPYWGADPLTYVLGKNLHRRHLTDDQRAFIAANMANLKSGKPLSKPELTSEKAHRELISLNKAAATVEVSVQKAKRARNIMNKSPQLASQVRDGKATLSEAENKLAPKKRETKPEPKAPTSEPVTVPTTCACHSVLEAIDRTWAHLTSPLSNTMAPGAGGKLTYEKLRETVAKHLR